MELRGYLKIVKKNIVLLTALALIGAFSSYTSTSFIKSGHKVKGIFYLSNSVVQGQQDNFSGYFTQSTAINATDTAVAILQSNDFQKNLNVAQASLEVRKIAPQVIEITVASEDPVLSEKLFKNIAPQFNRTMEELNPATPLLSLKPLTNQVNTFYSALDPKIMAISGAVVGILFAFLILGLRTYLKF